MINPQSNFEKSVINGSQLTTGDVSTFGRTDRKLIPQTEKIRRRNFTTRFAENLRKGKKKVSSICQNFEESDSDESIPYAPGPGSYNNETEQSFANKTDNSPFQYFGSTSPRFLESDFNKFPGPGTYNKPAEIQRAGPIETSMFKGERRIETIFDKFMSNGPGPGKYEENRTEFISKKKYKNRKGN